MRKKGDRVGMIRMGRYSIALSKEEKLMFPADGLTKADVIDYYRRVADAMLIHLRDRPVVMQRFPDGIDGKGFYHKDAPDYFPEWIDRIPVRKREGGTVDYVVCDKAATLVYLANQGCITLHHWLSRTRALDYPDQLVFDLDPPEGGFDLAVSAARLTHGLLQDLGLRSYVKTTGGKGLHVVVPLDGTATYDGVREFARAGAEVLAARDPDNLTTEFRISRRRGRLFIDTGRNAYGQHVVAPYSLRPRAGVPVATPVRWDELHENLNPSSFTPVEVLGRVQAGLDPWSDMRRDASALPEARRRLEGLSRKL